MKFDDIANSILGEDWHDRWAERHEGPGLGNLRGMSDVQDPAEIQWREAGKRAAELKRKEAELDKKEAYKANLMRQDEDEEEIDPLTDPMFRKALDILEDLQARSPDKFEKFVTRLMDLVDYKKGVSL